MEYDTMLPEDQKKEWREMSPRDAKLFFKWFSDHIPSKMEQLRNLVEATGNDSTCLDYSENSLIFIWKWYHNYILIENIPEKDIITSCEQQVKALLNISEDKGGIVSEESYKKLFVRCYDNAPKKRILPPWGFIAMDIGIYLGECLIRKYPEKGIRWGFFTKPKKMDGVNRPVLLGLQKRYVKNFGITIQTGYYYDNPVDLIHLLYLKAGEYIKKSNPDERALLNLFRNLERDIYRINTPQSVSEIREMNKEEAQQYFFWFTNEIENNIKEMGMCDITDFSKDSLTRVWERFLDMVDTVNKEEMEKNRPSSSNENVKKPLVKVKISGVELYEGIFIRALDISTYFAEVFRREYQLNGIKWGYVTSLENLPYGNRPVLIGFHDPQNPVMDQIGLFTDLTIKVVKGDRTKHVLMDLYKEWEKRI